MSAGQDDGGLHIDGDWKAEAAKEKERLAEQEKVAPPAGAPPDNPGFAELLNMLAMQAIIGIAGYQGPGGEHIPPNPAMGKHHIDMLEVLEEKTKGNLTDEEKKAMDTVLYELRMQYVQAVSGGEPGVAPPADTVPPGVAMP